MATMLALFYNNNENHRLFHFLAVQTELTSVVTKPDYNEFNLVQNNNLATHSHPIRSYISLV